jgi:hypothetical protein
MVSPFLSHLGCSWRRDAISKIFDPMTSFSPAHNHPGTVLNLGADWRLTDAQGVIRPDARYAIRTNDGTNVVVVTEGFPLPDGRTMLRGKFETGSNGTYAWLNDVVGVGVLKRNGTSAVRIDMWHVS